MAKDLQFAQDKQTTLDNLESIQVTLQQCVNDGMMDEDDHYYNELLELIDEARIVKTNPELAEVIAKAKTLETDIDAWLSMRRKETLSISWPKI